MAKSWIISDELWKAIKALISKPSAMRIKNIREKQGRRDD
jgi:hypothetical protein